MSVKTLDFLGVVSPGAHSIAVRGLGDPSLLKTIVPGAAVGVAGWYLWPKHPVLGFLAGDAIGLNAYRTWRNEGDDRTRAWTNFATAATGIAGSLVWKKHPVLGWLVGVIAGSLAVSTVPGSNAYNFRQRLK